MAKYATFLELPAGMHSQDNTVILKYLRKNSSNRSASSTSSTSSAAGSKSSSANNSAHFLASSSTVGVRDGDVVGPTDPAEPTVDSAAAATEHVTETSDVETSAVDANANSITATAGEEEKHEHEPTATGTAAILETIQEEGGSEQVVSSEDAIENSI